MRRLGALLLLCLSLVGCVSLTDITDLANRLSEAGFRNVSVVHRNVNGTNYLVVAAAGDNKSVSDVGRMVWDTYPVEIDELVVSLNGEPEVSVSAAALERQFGPRRIDVKPAGSVLPFLLYGFVFFILLGLGVVAIVVIVKKRRRRLLPPPEWS